MLTNTVVINCKYIATLIATYYIPNADKSQVILTNVH